MTMTKRAADALRSARIPVDQPSALRALVIYAAQNPGFEWGNYQTSDYRASLAAYRSDYRTALKGWQDVRTNARICQSCGVTDEDIFQAQQHAFSGRVTVEIKHSPECPIMNHPDSADHGSCNCTRYSVDYCTGQYFPTEYRRAIACVLDRAAEIAYERAKAA